MCDKPGRIYGYDYWGCIPGGDICAALGVVTLILFGDDVTWVGVLDDVAIPPAIVATLTACTIQGGVDLSAKYGPFCGGWGEGGVTYATYSKKWWNPASTPNFVLVPTCK